MDFIPNGHFQIQACAFKMRGFTLIINQNNEQERSNYERIPK